MRGFDGKIALSYGGFELAPGVVVELFVVARLLGFTSIPVVNLPKGVIPHLSNMSQCLGLLC